jgi:hypothetical protein
MFFKLTDISAHPGGKIWVSRSARRASVFSECPCGTRDKVPFGQINAFGEFLPRRPAVRAAEFLGLMEIYDIIYLFIDI